MELKLAFIGFGNVARAFARMMESRRTQLDGEFGLRWRTTAIATANHGCVLSNDGLDLNEAVDICESGGNLTALAGVRDATDATRLIESCEADVLFETTPLNPGDGQPAISYISSALERGINVVTANKGPLAFAYRRLIEIAAERGAAFRFEGAVMDGAPVFNLFESCLPAVKLLGFEGIVNSTTNHILTGMESGRSFDECLTEARRLGIAEANADYDVEGWDAAVKATALANVLMGADVHPADVERHGIRGITRDQLSSALEQGGSIRLVARAYTGPEGLKLTVGPETVARTSPLDSARGTSNVLLLKTDLMGEIAIFEGYPGIQQTAYALLSDLLRIHGRGQ